MLSEKLLTLRKHAGLSQQEVANALGVTRQTVSNWEAGQGAPALDKAIALATLYRISLNDLVSDEVEIAVGRKGSTSSDRSDMHVLHRAVGKRCKLVCADSDWMLYGHPGGAVNVLDANENWIRISFVRRKDSNPFKRETVTQLLDAESVYAISILGDIENDTADVSEGGDL